MTKYSSQIGEEIPIFFATENNYYYPTLLAIYSILNHSNSNNSYKFHILVSADFPDFLQTSLISEFKEYPNASFVFTKLNEFADSWQRFERIPNTTYYRLLIPSLFSEYDKVIYLDSDIIVKNDISLLYKIDIDKFYVAGVPAPWYVLEADQEKYSKKLEIPDMKKYINAGVLLLNSKKIRNDNLSQLLVSMASYKFESEDQDIINKVLYHGIKHLHLSFNAMTKLKKWTLPRFKGLFSQEELETTWENPKIIHYADKIKPWADPDSPYAQIWWDMAKQLKDYNQIYQWAKNSGK